MKRAIERKRHRGLARSLHALSMLLGRPLYSLFRRFRLGRLVQSRKETCHRYFIGSAELLEFRAADNRAKGVDLHDRFQSNPDRSVFLGIKSAALLTKGV